ncbi:family 2 encapsulin nanocompartment cargo protein terpene cyclase [Streptomyces sp. 7N604]|uniref:family 2 encapsulin nanocompartment cargo protein terpene cyclase n=1 Tax=Streptomyces sp. 7N604 TaxID=3457415 RepID=UPI003FD333ED
MGATRGTEQLYCPPPVRDDPVLADEINRRILVWMDEVGLGAEQHYEGVLAHDPGRGTVLCHPGCDDIERLMGPAKMVVAETAVDDYFCETNRYRDRADQSIGPNLSLAQSAIDPPRLTEELQAAWEKYRDSQPVIKAQHQAMNHLAHYATPAQLKRAQHDIAQLYLGYQAENGWRIAGQLPPVWQYLANRQMNSFRPCLTLTDSVDGYEIPPQLYAHPLVQDATATAALATTLVNDLYSTLREIRGDGLPFNLPCVIATDERLPLAEAFRKAVRIHNDLMHAFEESAAEAMTAVPEPAVVRYLTGVWNWTGGNREWHATSTRHQVTDTRGTSA